MPDFLSETESTALFQHITSAFDVTDKSVRMESGQVFQSEVSSFIFTEPELTSLQAFPAVWGRRGEWLPSLKKVRDQIQQLLGIRFEVGRCIYYQHGEQSMGFHKDMPAYGCTEHIVSLSLGAARTMAFRQEDDHQQQVEQILANGSLLYMGPGCQAEYEHALLPAPECTQPRINITFRRFGG